MATTPVASSSAAHTRVTDHPRLIEVVAGRLLELVVLSVEGARERMRARHLVH